MSTYANYGDELVPTLLNTAVWYHFMLESKILNALKGFVMPSNPYDWPVVTGGPTVRKVAEIADQASFSVPASPIPVSKIGTAKVTFSAGGIGVMVLGSTELFEDSAASVQEVWSTQLIRQMASAIDYVLLNGDETASVANISHYGTDPTGTAYDKILILDGLRHKAFDNSDTTAVATMAITSPTTLRATMGARGKFALQPKDLVLIMDPGVYYKSVLLSDMQSMASVGEQAVLLTGQVGQLVGIPVIVADELEATNASGQIEDSHDTTKGSLLVVNRNNIMVGRKREVGMDMVKIPGVEGFAAWTTVRMDLQEMEAGQVAYGYNTTV